MVARRILWLQVARAAGARPSARQFSTIGIVLVPLTLLSAYLALILLNPAVA